MNSYYVGSDTNNLQKKMFSFSSVSEYLDEFNKMPFLYKKKKNGAVCLKQIYLVLIIYTSTDYILTY